MKDPIKHAIGARLKQAREALSMSRQAFASLLLADRSTILRNETGQTFPRLQVLTLLATKKGISLDWLMSGTGEMFGRPVRVDREITDFIAENEAVEQLLARMKEDRRVMFHILSTMENYTEPTP
ncbi:MAG: helix-turn-helix transcriptional regulator [bacterium]|nr:helix-turn-helix transcriptional regulator [bacterium]